MMDKGGKGFTVMVGMGPASKKDMGKMPEKGMSKPDGEDPMDVFASEMLTAVKSGSSKDLAGVLRSYWEYMK